MNTQSKTMVGFLAVMMLMTAAAPTAQAEHLEPVEEIVDEVAQELKRTVLSLQLPSAPGCYGGPVVAFAALPGQVKDTKNIEGCRTLIVSKPANADAQIAINGGQNALFCDWRPLEAASCSGLWIYFGGGTRVDLVIMGGTPGAVALVGI
jgi:hypothetical protein